MRRTIFITAIHVLGSLVTNAQNLSKDLSKLNNAYFDLNKTIHVEFNPDFGNSNVSVHNYKVHMRGIGHYLMSFEGSQILVTPEYKLVLNENLKTILIDSNRSQLTSPFPVQFFDTLIQVYKSHRHEILGDGKEAYTLVPSNSNTEKLRIVFDRSSMLIERIEMNIKPRLDYGSQKAVVTYRYSPLSKPIPPITSYLLSKQNLNQPHPRYGDYRVINQINP